MGIRLREDLPGLEDVKPLAYALGFTDEELELRIFPEALHPGPVTEPAIDVEPTAHLEFIERQKKIIPTLGRAGLAHLIPFMIMYTDLSEEVPKGFIRGHEEAFKHRHWVANNMPYFGYECHDDLALFVLFIASFSKKEEGKYDESYLEYMNIAWLRRMFDERMTGIARWQNLFADIMTHIRSSDLGHSMRRTKPGNTPKDYYDDYTFGVRRRIDAVIKRKVGEYMVGEGRVPRGLPTVLSVFIAQLRKTAYKNQWKMRDIEATVADEEERERLIKELCEKLDRQADRRNRVIASKPMFVVGSLALKLMQLAPAHPEIQVPSEVMAAPRSK